MTNKAFIAGVGMIPFAKPGANAPYPGMAAQATRLALADAGVAYDLVQQAYVGYVYGDSTAGQKALYGVGMTGIPIVNVNNNCSTGSTALFLARQAVASGAAGFSTSAAMRATVSVHGVETVSMSRSASAHSAMRSPPSACRHWSMRRPIAQNCG